MEQNRKLKVFLCHSKDDKPKVRELYRRLVADGFDAWLDEEKLIPGQDWDLEIRKAIGHSHAVVVCLSNNTYTKAGYVQKEILFALDVAHEQPEGAIYLIPARFEDCQVRSELSKWHWVNLFDEAGYKKLNQALMYRANALGIEIAASSAIKTFEIPIYKPISAGPFLPSNILYGEQEYVKISGSLIPKNIKPNDLFAIEVVGNSLNDALINDGDTLIMAPSTLEKVKNGDMVSIWIPKQNEIALKYFFQEKSHYRLQPANPTMKAIYVKKDEPLEIKGKVVMVVRQAKD